MAEEKPTPKNLPSGLDPVSLDRAKPLLDLKNTTVRGALREIISHHYSYNAFEGVNGFYGRIIQKIDDPKLFENGSGFSILAASEWVSETFGKLFGETQKEARYKVRIPSLDYDKLDPFDPDLKLNEAGKNKILQFYDEFTLSQEALKEPPTIGDIVFVTYGNLENRKDGKILYKVGPVTPDLEKFQKLSEMFAMGAGGFVGTGAGGVITVPGARPNFVPRSNNVGPTSQPPRLDLCNIDSFRPLNPTIKGNPCNPDRELYNQVINQFSVDVNPRYTPRHIPGTSMERSTFCNILVFDVTRAMNIDGGVYYAKRSDHTAPPESFYEKYYNPFQQQNEYYGMDANTVVKYLQAHGPSRGFKQVNAQEAQAAANMGFCVVVGRESPGGIGHVGIIRPGIMRTLGGHDDPVTANSGGSNFNIGFVSQSFGDGFQNCKYFAAINRNCGGKNVFEEAKKKLEPEMKKYLEEAQALKANLSGMSKQEKAEAHKQIQQLINGARSLGSDVQKYVIPS